jgi:hypothetical protein
MHGRRRPALQKREKNIKSPGRRERLVEELKAVTEEIFEGQKRKEETRQEIEEIKPECQKLKEDNMIISKQIDCNPIKANLMLSILKAREDKNFAQAAQLTQLLRFVD